MRSVWKCLSPDITGGVCIMERPERIWPEPEPPIGEEKARPPAFRRANRHCPQFKSSLIPLKTKGTRNSNSHSERCFGIHPVERTAENRRDAGVTKGREPTGRRKKSKPYGAS